ncbi:hypothetical protein [Humibacter sp.]|uniref:hypothetical protein n=1 Tax=Humibacter sp. TaxID=1940291 RepID=UPI003F7F67A6
MRIGTRKTALLVVAGFAGVVALAGCKGTVDPGGPEVTASSPAVVATTIPGPIPFATGAPPLDPDAVALAQKWIDSAAAPPGVRVLDAAPAYGPDKPSVEDACDWLVTATKWWSVTASGEDAAKAWLRDNPVAGLSFDGTMTGPNGVSAIFEHAAQKRDDSVEFEFAPSGKNVVIRVDAIVVPDGAECTSSGGGAQAGH